MKKNLLKRIGAVALAVAVSLTMGTAAFAADTFEGQAYKGNGTLSTTDVKNAAFSSVLDATDADAYLPATQITYSIAAGTATSYTDTAVTPNKTVAIKAGVGIGTFISLTQPEAFTTSDKDKATKDVGISFNMSGTGAPTEPGIYRYTVSTGLTDNQKALGIANDGSDAKWLDVYVTRQNGSLIVSNAVMFEPDADPAYDSADAKLDYDTSKKVDGFKYTYTTGTITIEKQVSGTMGDQSQAFGFATTLSNDKVGASQAASQAATAAIANVSGGSITTAATWNVDGSTANAYTLKHGETLTISGLPLTTVALIEETYANQEGYTVSYTVSDGSSETGTSVEATAANGTEVPVVFTNELNSISPTNVVMRFAPYLFILGAAIVLLVLMRRRRASRDTE